MERVVVDPNGAATIPPEIIQKRGLSPGGELNIVETEQGWMVSPNGSRGYRSPLWEKWWAGLTEEQREQAREEARQYLALSEEEQDAFWNMDEELAWVDEDDDDEDEEEDDDEKEANRSQERQLAEHGSAR